MDNKFKTCPRCNGRNIVDFRETIECTECHLEFYKKDIERFKPNQLLAISEKINISRSFKENK